jgi:hypothetical protein
LAISVYDNGPGFSSEDEEKLFQPFTKLNDAQQLNPSGNGLGLSICKQICNNLGGNIEGHSNIDSWTKFTFWVPVKTPSDYDADLMVNTARNFEMLAIPPVQTKSKLTLKALLSEPEQFGAFCGDKKLCIICADDIYYNLEALRLVFSNLGLEEHCSFLNDGRQVVRSCIKNVEDSTDPQNMVTIVIVDFEMPVMSGLEAIKEIKAYYNEVN